MNRGVRRVSPLKSTSALRLARDGLGMGGVSVACGWSDVVRVVSVGFPGPRRPAASSFGWKLFIEAQALTSVPSTEKVRRTTAA